MNLFNRAASGLTLALALTAGAGCSDNIALIGRPSLELGQDEFVAEVERLDTASREIHLRPNNSRTRVVVIATQRGYFFAAVNILSRNWSPETSWRCS